MENRVVALAVLENLIHWPLPHRSGYVAPCNTAEDGGEDGNYNTNTVSAGDADDLLKEPRQRRLDRYRAVLLLPHLCHKLGTRWVESEVVPYLLRCLEEDDAQLSLVSGLALLGVTLPRRSLLSAPTAAATAEGKSNASPSNPPPTNVATPTTVGSTTTTTSTIDNSNAYLSLEDVQPVCTLFAASGTEETRAFAAQVILPHLYFGTSLERDITLESWDLKFVPLSVLHADMISSNSSGGLGEGDSSPVTAAAAARAEEGCDEAATISFIAAVRKQLLRQRYQEDLRRSALQQERMKGTAGGSGESDPSPSSDSTSNNASFPKINARDVTEEDVRRCCQQRAVEDEEMQFLFSGSYDTLTGPWGFSGCRLASLTQGAMALVVSSNSKGRSSGGANTICTNGGKFQRNRVAATCVGGGFRSFRTHERRVSGSQTLRGAPPPSQRPLSDADLELYGASYAVDKANGSNNNSGDDFFSVNVRARALVSDLTQWMETITPASPAEAPVNSKESRTNSTSSTAPSLSSSMAPQLFVPGQTVTLYDYLSHEGRRGVLRSRWQAQMKLLQSLLVSPYPGPVAVAVELISGLLHALQFVAIEVEEFFQRGSNNNNKTFNIPTPSEGAAASDDEKDADMLLWGIGVPSTPLLSTAQLQSFIFRMTRRHVAYCIAAAVTTRKANMPSSSLSASTNATMPCATFAAAAAATAWRAPTGSLARLLRAALPVAQKTLTDLLLSHHILVRLTLFPSGEQPGSTSGISNEYVPLQMGAGPCELRAEVLSAWDVSFLPSSTQAGLCLMPDDTSFLLNTPTADPSTVSSGFAAWDGAAVASALDRSLWLPGTLNAFSIFRVHRIVRRALLRALPLAVDFLCLANPTTPHSGGAAEVVTGTPSTSTTASAPTTSIFTLCAVCPMLLQVLVSPGTLPALLRVLYAAAALPEEVTNAKSSSNTAVTKNHHTDPSPNSSPSSLEVALPTLWTAMTAPGSILGTAGTATAGAQGQETPSSLDFELLEAALDAVQRLTAEAAVQLSPSVLPSATSLLPTTERTAAAAATISALQTQTIHSVCAQLFTLISACVQWVPRYTNWKARWLIAQKLPRLISTFCFLLATVAELSVAADEAKEKAAGGLNASSLATTVKPFQQVAVIWLQCTLQLLTSVWSCAEAFGVAPLNDLTDDEEVEVRCITVRCAAFLFRRVGEAVLRVSAAVTTNTTSMANNNGKSSPSLLMLPSLTEPLAQLLDATAQCVLVGANDVDPRVRCCATEALAVLSRTLCMLVAADGDRSRSTPSTTTVAMASMKGKTSEEAVWMRYLRSNTDALLRLMSDEKPTVQLALVSQLTDLLLLCMREPAGHHDKGGNSSLTGSRDDADEAFLSDSDGQQRSVDQVQHEALLQCLRQLSQHELWRLREQYAVLLAHLCGRLLQTAMIRPRNVTSQHSAASRASQNGGLDDTTSAAGGAIEISSIAHKMNGSMQADASPYGHTHPLYQLARTELLTLLVGVLFDKVKAVRDTALDAVERMCLQLAAATRQSNSFLQKDAASSSGLAGTGGAGVGEAVSGGRNFELIISSSPSLQNVCNVNYNINTFVDDVLWPRISAYDKAWETYLSRSALLHIALRLRVDKTSVFIPLLDQLARDPVLNVRLVVAKIILEVLLRNSPDVCEPPFTLSKGGEEEGSARGTEDTQTESLKPDLPSGTEAYRILMNKPALLSKSGSDSDLDSVMPPLQFTEEERTGVILQILRQLLKDASSDVRDEAAKALRVCF